ncbi:MAG: GNAT family N-acetyltransferase [Candidatus Saccharibacteria bacterium]
MKLTMTEIANNPKLATSEVVLGNGEKVVLRPLEPNDISKLATFLQGLSQETRRLSTFEGYDTASAKELCDAINKYDKLRFVIENSQDRIVGLIELSFGFPESDIERYSKTGYTLNPETDLRFGPTLADDYQNVGLGSKVFPFIVGIANKFGKKRIILWGGVLKDNERAIHYYEKLGFKNAGTFKKDGVEHLDMIIELKDYPHS